MDYEIENIIEDLVKNYGAIVSRLKTPKYLVYLDDIEYKISDDESLIDFYKHFCGMLKYS